MIPPRAFAGRTAAGLVTLLAAGCAHEPGFRAELPAAVDGGRGTIAIIGDMQQTPGFVRLLRRREETSESQSRLVEDLVDRAFRGSPARLVMQALSNRPATKDELAEIRRLLDNLEGRDS